jgi:hypothetical protein
MFYEIVLLTIGVYIGQEYNTIPSVRLVVVKAIGYCGLFKSGEQQPQNNSVIMTILSIIRGSNG